MRLILLLLFTLTLLSAQKVALVIGNQNYSSHTQLKNPINDAKLIKKTLENLGFDVLVAYDADIDALDKSISTFMKKAKKADVALVYYAGHGIGVEGRNYLIPVDTHNLSKSNLSRKLISLNELQDSVAKAKKFGVVLFDACRNSFFRQNIEGLGNARASRALVRPTVRHTRNILVSFSTQAGTIAKDDIAGGKHSPYALALSEKLKESKDIRLVMGGVKDRVLELTDNAQEPIDRSSLGGDAFYINGKAMKVTPVVEKPKRESRDTRIKALLDDGILDLHTKVEIKPSVKLRHGYSYSFNNTVNAGNKSIWIRSFNGSTFAEIDGNFNGKKNPKFSMPFKIKNRGKLKGYHILKGSSDIVFKSEKKYAIHYHPTERRKDNLYIKYITHFNTWDESKEEWDDEKTIITHQPYEITWCGDGIIDNYIDVMSGDKIVEVCDRGDTRKKNWGIVGCSTVCTPLN